MDGELVLIAALGCAALSAGVFAYLVMQEDPGAKSTPAAAAIQSPLLKIAMGMARAFQPLHQNALETPKGKQVERWLRQAGRPLGLTVPQLLALRYVGAILGAVIGFFFSSEAAGEASLTYIAPMAIFGFFYPTMRVKTTIKERRQAIFRDLPYVLDLITLSTEAGQDLTSALRTVIEQGPPGPLLEELRATQQEIQLGKTRADALRSMAERVDLPELSSLVFALIQAEQLGASVSAVLRIMAEEMRVKRWTLADEAAGKVPVKLMAPLVVCIFPASFIVLFVPIYIRNQMVGGL